MLAGSRSASERRKLANLSLAAVLALTGVTAAVLYRFPPAVYGFYPVCPVHEYLHLECPGCGTTRALAALLHGHVAEALRLNAFAIGLVLPLLALYGAVAYARAMRERDFHWPRVPTSAVYAAAALTATFAIARNL
jgi:hypothetical protein